MRFCNGIPNDRYRIVADENRWQVGYASPFRDGRGGNVFRPGTAAHGWRALTFPPAPFLASLVAWRARSRTGRGRFPTCPLGGWTRGHMRGVGVAPSPSPQPPSAPPLGARKGEGAPSPSPWPPSSPPLGTRKGEGAAFPSPSPLHRFVRRSACSFPPLPYTDDLIDERSVAWGDR